MGKHKYHHLESLLKKEEVPDMIKGCVLGKNNLYTGEVMEFDLNQLISPGCSGSCGASRAICILREKNCFNWQCFNPDCDNNLIIIRRKKNLIGKPVCQVCRSHLIRSSKSQYD